MIFFGDRQRELWRDLVVSSRGLQGESFKRGVLAGSCLGWSDDDSEVGKAWRFNSSDRSWEGMAEVGVVGLVLDFLSVMRETF